MKTRNLAYCGLFGALSLTLPMVFHALGLAGVTFLPMYWPLVTLAFLVPARNAVFVAALMPWVSMCLTGMPVLPLAPVISLELAVQVALLALFRKCAGGRHPGQTGVFAAVAAVLVFGRFLHTGLVWSLVQLFPNVHGVPRIALTAAAFLTGWPGVVLMLVFVPVFVTSVMRRDGVCEVRFIKALRRMHLPEGVVLLSAQVLRWFEALSRDAEMLAKALELRRVRRDVVRAPAEEKAVSIRNLKVVYPGASEAALQLKEFDVAPGERIALTGANGSGKTTLLSVLCGFAEYSGDVTVFGMIPRGAMLKKVRARIGVLFENPDDQFIFPTVREDVGHALEGRGMTRKEIDARIDGLLTALGLPTGNRPIASLSRGQRQRVAIAGVLAAEPDLLLLDEPTAALDAEERKRLAAVLREQPSAMLTATHDAEFAAEVSTRITNL